jgi:hypothetical protein
MNHILDLILTCFIDGLKEIISVIEKWESALESKIEKINDDDEDL